MSLGKFKDTVVGKIPIEWDLVSLGEQLDLITDYHSNGSYKTLKEHVDLKENPDYAVMVRTTNFEQNDFENSLRYVDKSAYEFLEKSKVFPDDIIMNKIANAGSVYLMPDLNRPVSLAMNLFLLRMKPTVNQRYTYYYLKHNEKYLKTFAQGSVTKTITKDNVRRFPLVLPPIEIQNKIDYILSLFYKKITTLEKINKKLDELLMTIFKNWFVYFKNSDEFKDDEEFGKIPKSWSVEMLEDYVDFVTGVEPGSKNYHEKPKDNDIPFLRVGDLGSRSGSVFIDKSHSKNKILKYDDIVLSLDATIGIVKIGLEGAYSTGMRKLIIKNENINKPFLYCLVKSNRIQRIIKTFATGTTILHAGKSIKYMDFVLPDENTMNQFAIFGDIILSQILNNKKEIEVLTNLRDILLPKIMSGEIDISKINLD